VLRFKHWLEHSYQEKDIPEFFFLGFEWRPRELKEHRLVGVNGISESGGAISRFIDDGCALVLNGKETEKINDISRVLYNNPHYMASKGFDAGKRVMNWSDEKLILQLLERTFLSLPIPSNFASLVRWYGNVTRYVAQRIGLVKDFRDFVRKAWSIFISSDLFKELPSTIRPSMELFAKTAETAAKRVFTRYSDEEEWRVKPSWRRGPAGVAERVPVFNIPYKSILMVCTGEADHNFTADIRTFGLEESYEIYMYDHFQDMEADLQSYGRRW
jgi:hypothetical protein